MIAEFDKNVSDFVKDDVTKVWTEMKPFPVRNLISTNKITIDETFEVNNLTMTLSNIEIPIGPKLMQVKVIKLDKKLTRTYVGQMDSYV
jgi:hypothetical protein